MSTVIKSFHASIFSTDDPQGSMNECYEYVHVASEWPLSKSSLPKPIFNAKSSFLDDDVWVISGTSRESHYVSDEAKLISETLEIQTHNGQTFRSRGKPKREIFYQHCNVKIDEHKVFLAPFRMDGALRHYVLDFEDYDDMLHIETTDNVLPYNDSIDRACGVSKNADEEVIVVIIKNDVRIASSPENYLYNVVKNEFSTGPNLPFNVHMLDFPHLLTKTRSSYLEALN